jgi:hypothetical protein
VTVLLFHLAGFAQADHTCVPNAAARAIPAVVPKVGLTPRSKVRVYDNTAVLPGDLPPHNVIGELPLDFADKIASIRAAKCVAILITLQEPDMAGKIVSILSRKHVDRFRASQKKYSRRIANEHGVPIAQVFETELNSFTPALPGSIYIEPDSIRFWMPALQIAHPAQSYRIRCPVIVGHAA